MGLFSHGAHASLPVTSLDSAGEGRFLGLWDFEPGAQGCGGKGGFLGWDITVSHRSGMLRDSTVRRALWAGLEPESDTSYFSAITPPARLSPPCPLLTQGLCPEVLQKLAATTHAPFMPLWPLSVCRIGTQGRRMESTLWHLGMEPKSTGGGNLGQGRDGSC